MHVFFLVLFFCWAKLGRVFTRIEAQISHASLSPLEHCCIFLRNMCYWENQPCHCASLHPRLVFCASLFHFAFRFFKKNAQGTFDDAFWRNKYNSLSKIHTVLQDENHAHTHLQMWCVVLRSIRVCCISV